MSEELQVLAEALEECNKQLTKDTILVSILVIPAIIIEIMVAIL
jgi:hypothetical protein